MSYRLETLQRWEREEICHPDHGTGCFEREHDTDTDRSLQLYQGEMDRGLLQRTGGQVIYKTDLL